MPSIYYQRDFHAGGYYHLYNRGAHQQLLYHDAKDYLAFTEILRHYLLSPLGTPPSVITRLTKRRTPSSKVPFFAQRSDLTTPPYRLLAYCLMPNHFHLMLEQVDEELTLSNLMRRLSVAYAMYYNSRYHNSGTILQGKYKNVRVESEMQWLYLTKYIHRNPLHNQQSSDLCKKILADYPYSSYPNYLGKRSDKWIDTGQILARYRHNPSQEYQEFVTDSDPGPIERLTLDSEEYQ